MTHVLLPVSALLRRADTAAVIVSALAAKAQRGLGFRRIAADLGRPGETVRGWLRRFAERAEAVRSMFTVWLCAVDPDPVMPDAAGGVFADAVRVIAAVATVIERRFALPTVSLAETAVAVSGGRVLAPGWPVGGCNTSRPCRSRRVGRNSVRCRVFKDSKGGGRWRSATTRRRCGSSGPERSDCSDTS
jgi:hypothetical protein